MVMRTTLLSMMAIASSLAACGGSTDGAQGSPDGGAGNSSVQRACADAAKARCQKRDACTGGVSNKVKFGDEATCEARERASCETNLGAPGTGASSTSVEACAAALPGEACTDFLAGTVVAACQPKAGQGADGTPCVASAQCASTYCAVPKNAACGTCAPPPKAGDSCAATGACGAGLACLAITSVCVAEVGQGGTCDKNHPCATGSSCVGTRTNSTCQPTGASAGVTCDPSERTAPGCERTLGLYCNATTGKCEMATLVGPGQPCGVVPGGFAICTGGGACQLSTTTPKTGTCVAPVADGAPCDPQGGACLSPARCVVTTGTAGTCRLPDPGACRQ